MTKRIVILLLVCCGLEAAADGLPLVKLGTPFRRTDLDVRWKVSGEAWPKTVCAYHSVLTEFSSAAISNLMAIGSFTAKDTTNLFQKPDPRCLYFANADRSRSLLITPGCRAVEYTDRAANDLRLSEGVPSTAETLAKALEFFGSIGISRSELARDGSNVRAWASVRQAMLYINHGFITNVTSRGVSLQRSIDGLGVIGVRASVARMFFGNHGRVSEISLLWPEFDREKAHPTATTETIVKRICEGDAVLSPTPDNVLPIDWPTVKSLTITEARPMLFGDSRNALRLQIFPYLALKGVVDTGATNITVEIECPLIDDSRSAAR